MMTPAERKLVPHTLLRNVIRKVWWERSPERREALKAARLCSPNKRIGRPAVYRCPACFAFCSKPDVDHITPVGETPGAKGSEGVTWDGFMHRLFCAAAGLVVACRPCHQAKTKEGSDARVSEKARSRSATGRGSARRSAGAPAA